MSNRQPEPLEQPQVANWGEHGSREIRAGIFGSTIHLPQLTVTLYRYEPDSSWEEHSHPEDQVTSVLRGSIEFVLDGEAVGLQAGQVALLPGGTPHSATAGDQGAETLNVWTSRLKR